IAEAESGGADAIVMEINSPGGELGAVLEITAALKKTSVARTVAWINPQAYSGGAIAALACQEIVVATGSTMGDAAPIMIGPMGLRELRPTERAKILSPLLAEVVGSARRNGHDEKLVQGMVTLGVELWLVENAATGERLFIDRAEYEMLFEGEPRASNPRLVGLPGDRAASRPRGSASSGASVMPGGSQPGSSRTDLLPASPQITGQTAAEASLGLTAPSLRPVLTGADRGKWKVVEYVADGRSLFTFSDTDMMDLRMAVARVNTEADMRAYMGASSVITLSPAWYEAVARVMKNFWVRGVLIIVVVLGLFIEFVHPGLLLPASAAALAVVGLLLPEMLMGLAGWWELVLIVGGAGLIAVELFLLPGMGVAGALGLLSLFAGLVLAFVPASSPTFPGMERSSASLLWGVGFVLMGVATAVTLGYYMSKNMRTLSILGRFILTDRGGDDDETESGPVVVFPILEAPVVLGQEGVALTPLRPAGKADFDGRVVDVVVDGPLVGPGQRVRVMLVEQMRIVVEAVV
ncbi:MAG: hypothetical protein K2Q09_09055, partial [Phycisphaerales bacterium]|nr:hypothetical protein [Phycisphaerales bacterium]